MAIVRIGHVNLRAPRALLDALREFYRDAIGLRDGPRPPFRSFGYWLYAGDDDVLHLSETASEELRRTDVVTTFDHVAFAATGQTEFEARLAAQGIAYSIAQVPATGQIQLFLRDPAGNGVELTFASVSPRATG